MDRNESDNRYMPDVRFSLSSFFFFLFSSALSQLDDDVGGDA